MSTKTTDSSSQVLNVGDFVRTSKGNIGYIQVRECYSIVDSDGNVMDTVSVAETYEFAEQYAIYYYGCGFTIRRTPNQVNINGKVFPIWSDKLVKLDRVTIRTQQGFSQHNTTLPSNDAGTIISIYDRNKIWYALI